jgi:hypothetical protein
MNEKPEVKKYTGVRCHVCRKPIQVSTKMLAKIEAARADNSASSGENSPVLNLRCRSCEKENFYRISEVLDFEGAPEPPRGNRRPSLLQPEVRRTRAASA